MTIQSLKETIEKQILDSGKSPTVDADIALKLLRIAEEFKAKLKVAETALTESRECLNGMVYSGPLQKSWMARSIKSIEQSTAALAEIRK